MQYTNFTVLKVFIRTAKDFSLQFHSYSFIHSTVFSVASFRYCPPSEVSLVIYISKGVIGRDIESIGISTYNLLNIL